MSDNEERNSQDVSRRAFLKTTAAVSAAGVIGPYTRRDNDKSQLEAARASEEKIEKHWRETMGSVKLEKLLEPGYIGKVKTRNRMIKTAAYGWILWDAERNEFRPEGLGYYETIARGGIGLMVMEDPAFRPDTIGRPLFEDAHVEVEKELVDIIHAQDCPLFAQLTDFRPLMGIAASSEVYYPSKLDMNNLMPRALTVEEIKENTEMVAKGAERCQKAGYDGVEINVGCSHMFATFISRFWNKRDDQYGPQTLDNRARIVTEMIRAIKERCGEDFPVGILLNSVELEVLELGNHELCTTLDETILLAKRYEEAGADSIQARSHSIGNHINGFFPDYYFMFGEPDTGFGQPIDIKKYWPEFITEYGGAGAFIDSAAKIKKALSIPVISVGSMDPRLIPDVVETAIRDEKIDFVAMTRPLTADPELPKKLAEGNIEDVRPCTYCITCFPMTRCRVNAASTRTYGPDMPEGYDVPEAETKKKVVVVGGGPSGLEAARVAALRGHEVTLYEKSARLGGLMPLAAMVKGEHEKILDYVEYLEHQMDKLGVNVNLKTEADVAAIQSANPDAVIVAVGGLETAPDIPGVDHSIVMSSTSLHNQLELGLKFVNPYTLRDLTKFYLPVGDRVIIIGGYIQGVQLATFLSQRDKDITIVDEDVRENLGLNMPQYVQERAVLYNQAHGVKVLMGARFHEITDYGMTVTTSYGIKKTIPADSIIVALPTVPNSDLADSLKGVVSEVYTVGDCARAGVIVDAVESGHLTARKI